MAQTFTFPSAQPSDVTIHYQNASYHVHKFLLMNASKYFAEALSRDASSVQDTCSGAGCSSNLAVSCLFHNCLTVQGDKIGELGGVAVSVDDLGNFLRELYACYDVHGAWNKFVKDKRVRHPTFDFFVIQQMSDVATKEMTLDLYEHDGVYTIQSADEQLVKGAMLSSKPINTLISSSQCQDHPHYHLANYFECEWLLEKYLKQALIIAKKAASVSHFINAPWRLLRLAERYNWPDVRDASIAACIKQKKFHEDADRQQLIAILSSVTLQEIIKAMSKQQS